MFLLIRSDLDRMTDVVGIDQEGRAGLILKTGGIDGDLYRSGFGFWRNEAANRDASGEKRDSGGDAHCDRTNGNFPAGGGGVAGEYRVVGLFMAFVVPEELTNVGILSLPVGNPRGVVRMGGKPGLDLCATLLVKKAVDIGMQLAVIHGLEGLRHFGLRRLTMFCSASTSRRRWRARERRDITVPIGISRISATS